jgi:hypothetical protein
MEFTIRIVLISEFRVQRLSYFQRFAFLYARTKGARTLRPVQYSGQEDDATSFLLRIFIYFFKN